MVLTDDDLAELLVEASPSPSSSTGSSSLPPLVVRIHRLTQAQAIRICKWAQRLPCTALADVTLPAGAAAVNLLEEQLRLRGLRTRVRIHTFTSSDMEREYPFLRHTSLEKVRQRHLWMMPALSHAWAYTAEAITICGMGRDGAKEQSGYTWIFEHDCDVAGPIESLIRAYDDDDADLIAKELVPRATIAEWMWYECATDEFLARFGANRCCAHVHAIRISSRLLWELHDFAKKGLIGYGEMSIPTVCVGLGLTWRGIRDEHLGQPYHPQGNMDQKSFEALEREKDGRLYHALKY